MKKISLLIVLILVTFMSQAQVVKLSGPRIGVTVVTPGATADFIQNRLTPGDLGWNESTTAVITQYGWQFESRFADGENAVGLVEWVVLVGGMERGMFLPSISSLFGIRSVEGFEAALGPNLSLSGVGMVLGIGHTIKTASLNIPINISFVPGKNMSLTGWGPDGEEIYDFNTGARISLTLGFNLLN